ncbi:MAG: NAD(P)/FAD-dependent oxidoreductase [Candidatus Thorarchaeota archaeon]|nr:NAD(P)/FAD-dependent oxidoreductase [Candidatus Thorarchaeota archaeon]
MDTDIDVIIIGAGPAGLFAAKTIAEQDIDFILIMKEEEPCQEKTCGGFIPSRCLDEFGIKIRHNYREIVGLRMKFPGLDIVRVDFDESIGVNTTRAQLGKTMHQMVPHYQKITRSGTKVSKVSVKNERVKVDVDSKEGKDSLTSKIVIDASGANPVCVRSSLVRERIPNSSMGYGVQYQLALEGSSQNVESVNDFYYGHEYSPGGYAWHFPRVNESVVGTGGIVERVRTDKKRVLEYLDNWIQNVEPISTELKDARIIKKEAAPMPLAGIVIPSYDNRILLAGDAAGHCSPISGEGIHYSMLAGKIAAQTAVESIRKNDQSSGFLERYEKRWKGEFGSDLKWGAWLQKRLTSSGSTGMGSTFLKSEKSQRVIAEMLVGMSSVRRAILSAAPSYIGSKMKR